jgi:hypothetical protein
MLVMVEEGRKRKKERAVVCCLCWDVAVRLPSLFLFLSFSLSLFLSFSLQEMILFRSSDMRNVIREQSEAGQALDNGNNFKTQITSSRALLILILMF